jgi:hypothetical protein
MKEKEVKETVKKAYARAAYADNLIRLVRIFII